MTEDSNEGPALKDPNKSKNNKFRTAKMQKEHPNGYAAYRVQVPVTIAENYPEGTRFYVGQSSDGVIQMHPSGTGLPNPMDDTLSRPKRLKKADFIL